MSKALVLSLKNEKIYAEKEILLGGEWVLENQNIDSTNIFNDVVKIALAVTKNVFLTKTQNMVLTKLNL